jgi:hypothetical protein
MSTVSDVEPETSASEPEPELEPEPEQKRDGAGEAAMWPIIDGVMRGAGLVVAVALAAVTAAFEAALTPLYWGEVRLPIALVLAVVGNVGLVWFTVAVTGRRLAVAAPALVWTAVLVVASARTTEGDLVLTGNNWVGIGTMLAGSVTFGVAGFALIRTGVRPAGSGPASRE